MKRSMIALFITVFTVIAFASTAQAQSACVISSVSASTSTTGISITFDSAGCNGTFYAYVVNYTNDHDLVFSSFSAGAGPNTKNFSFSMAADDGDSIHLNLYHMGDGGYSSMGWSGTASAGAALAANAGGCSSDGRLNSDSCGGDNFAAYVGDTNSVTVWTATGEIAFQVSARRIEAMPDHVSENTLVAASSDQTYRLYKLTSGEYQLMVRKPDGKTSVMIFNLPFNGVVTTREE